jgi:hypothetical protein
MILTGKVIKGIFDCEKIRSHHLKDLEGGRAFIGFALSPDFCHSEES